MSWIYEAFEVLATGCESALILWFLSSFFGFNPAIKRRYILLAGFTVLSTVITTVYSQLLPNENFICAFIDIVVFFIFCCFLNGKKLSHFFISLVAETLLMLIAITINSFMSYITSYNSAELINDRSTERIIVLMVSKLLLFIAYKIILISHKNKPELKQMEWIAFAAIFFSTLFSGLCIYEMQINGYADRDIPLFPLSVLCLLVINLVSFYMLSKISKEHRENIKNSLLVMQIQEQEESISKMKNVYDEIRRTRHNIKEQYGCVRELLSNGKYDEANLSDDEAEEYIAKETEYFNMLIGNEVNGRIGFDKAVEQYRYISDLDSKNKSMFYLTGWNKLFGVESYTNDLSPALIALLAICLAISPLIAYDNRFRMGYLLFATKSGYKCYLTHCILSSAIATSMISAATYIPNFLSICNLYGTDGIFYSIRCIPEWNAFFDVPIIVWLITLFLLRTIVLLLNLIIILCISSFYKNVYAAELIALAIFTIPIAIYLIGIEFALTICSPVSINREILEGQWWYWVVLIVLAAYSVFKLYHVRKIF